MFKTHEKSKFKIVFDGEDAEYVQNKNGKTIIQIEVIQAVNNKNRVYILETVDTVDYERETVEGQLEVALEALDNQRAKADAMEELLEQSKDNMKEIADRLNIYNAENKKLFEALRECERIFGELPKEIKELLEGGMDNVYNGTI